jgi:uncharacterized protein (TIGR02271 family)
MNTSGQNDLRGWIGHDLVDDDGDRIGRIDDVYVDEDTGVPEWVAVHTGLFGTRISFVPLSGLSSDGDVLVSPWDKSTIKDSPNAEADGQLSQEEEARLYDHYGMGYSEQRSDSGLPEGGRTRTDKGRKGTGDDAMTRSEEEMQVSTRRHETGRARIRKWVETEHQTVTVPVRKEKAKLVTEPITDANRDKAMSGPDITEGEHEVILSEEEAVVDTRAVPKERVRLETETEVEEREVAADLRKEHIEMDDDASTRSRR